MRRTLGMWAKFTIPVLASILILGNVLVGVSFDDAFAKKEKVTICHKPATENEKTKQVPEEALKGHLGHGDTIGECETSEPPPPPPQNNAPVGVDDFVVVNEDGPAILIDVLFNDVDVDIVDILSVSSVDTTGTIGLVALFGDIITYDPNGQFEFLAVGEILFDTFSYTVTDGNGGFDTATVFVSVIGINDAPIAFPDLATTDEGTVIRIDVLSNDVDVDNGAILSVISIETFSTIGFVALFGNTITYDPNGQFDALAIGDTGFDIFSYTMSDEHGSFATEIVLITIVGV